MCNLHTVTDRYIFPLTLLILNTIHELRSYGIIITHLLSTNCVAPEIYRLGLFQGHGIGRSIVRQMQEHVRTAGCVVAVDCEDAYVGGDGSTLAGTNPCARHVQVMAKPFRPRRPQCLIMSRLVGYLNS